METIKAYFALTKPRIIELLLVAAIPAMLQAQRGIESVTDNFWLILSTIFGGWMGAAAAHTFNNVVDYEIDQKMQRTRARPLVRAKISRRNAAIFAWIMLFLSVFWLGVLAHSWLAAFFVILTNFFYVFVYTKFLKMRNPRTSSGVASQAVCLNGRLAVIRDNAPVEASRTQWQAIVLFLIIFFWTPPHTWALAMKYKEDYRKAGVPMLPVGTRGGSHPPDRLVHRWRRHRDFPHHSGCLVDLPRCRSGLRCSLPVACCGSAPGREERREG